METREKQAYMIEHQCNDEMLDPVADAGCTVE